MKIINLIFYLLLLVSTTVSGKVILPAVIDNNMVLQQKSEVALWGKASPTASIEVTTSWNGKSYRTQTGSDSLWQVSIITPTAGGPFQITFDDGEKVVLNNILIGEVWVCSGQSNMAMPVIGFKNQPITGSNELLLDADNPEIRLIQIERQYSEKPEFDFTVRPWTEATMHSVSEFSAIGYMYAKLLQQKLKVPVGIIMTAWGGTKIEAWMDSSSFNSNLLKQSSKSITNAINHNSPTVLYNAMINPMVGFGIKGVIWYQGEANRVNYTLYDQLMESMVKGWRDKWNNEKLSFYYVQIAPFRYDGDNRSAFLREAQLKASSSIANSGMIVSLDVGKETFIHPPDKSIIAKRLFLWAMANNYGMTELAHKSPEYRSHKIVNDVVTISFSHANHGLSSFGKNLVAFEIAGEDKIFYPAKATIVQDGVKVQSDQVLRPVAVRYAFKDWVIGNLYNTEGFPASSFRTDNW